MNKVTQIGHPIYLKGMGACGIIKDLIAPTIQAFAEATGIAVEDMRYLGSTGKVDWSGDIDIALDASKYDPIEVHTEISDVIGQRNCTLNTGTRVGSYAYCVRGDQLYPKVQIDIMYVNNTNLAEFTFFSPGDASCYKGAVRTILLQAVASSIDEEGVDHFHYDEHGLLIRAGRTLDLPVGIRRIFQHRPMRKDGKGHVKTLKTISKEEFNEYYPDIHIKDLDDVIDDPSIIVQVLFGSGVTESEVETAEEVLNLILYSDHFTPAQRNTIVNIARTRVKPLDGKIDLPNILRP
jgi:hypothetical protein